MATDTAGNALRILDKETKGGSYFVSNYPPYSFWSANYLGEAHAALECKVSEIVRLKGHKGETLENYLVIGEVVAFHIDDAFIKNGRFDTAGARPLARCGYQDYAVVEKLIALERPRGGGDQAA